MHQWQVYKLYKSKPHSHPKDHR